MTNQDTALVAQPTAVDSYQLSAEQLQIVKTTICKDLTNAEFGFVVQWCEQAHVSPFLKHIHVWKQGDKLIFQMSIDGMRAIGMRQKDENGQRMFMGRLGPLWCGKDGIWKDVWLEDGNPVAAKVGIKWRGCDEPIWNVARWASYAKRQGAGTNWQTGGDFMTAKVSEAGCWRVVCPIDLAGVYTDGEIPNEPAFDVDTESEPVQQAQRATRPPAAHTAPQTTAAQPEIKPDPSGVYNIGKVRNVLNRSGFKTMAQQDGFLSDHGLVLKPSYDADEWNKITDALSTLVAAPTPAAPATTAPPVAESTSPLPSVNELRTDIITWYKQHSITPATIQEWCHRNALVGLTAKTAEQLAALLHDLRDTPATLAELQQLQDELQGEEEMAQQ